MTNSKPQYGFDSGYIREFREKLLKLLPSLERLTAVIREFCVSQARKATPLPCDSCPEEEKCGEACKLLNSMLPNRYGGKTPGETTIGIDFDNFRTTKTSSDDVYEQNDQAKSDRSKLKNIRKVTFLDVFEQYKKCWGVFTDKQREVLFLRYQEGKTIEQIAKALGKAPSTVCMLLKRAEKRKQEYDEKEIEKILRLKRKMRTE